MSKKKTLNRRDFLRSTAALSAGAFAAPALIPGSALGKNGAVAPGRRITMGCIGIGNMGTSNMRSFLELKDVQIVAVCDLDSNRLQKAKETVDAKYGNSDCRTYHDFRELIARNDIDAISMATPDHWHALVAVAAAESGKDVYGEKPLSHCIAEGRAMCDAVHRHGRIWQTGSWQRSVTNFRQAVEIVRNGLIGNVGTVHVGLPSGYSVSGSGTEKDFIIQPPPPELDYNFWIGPSPYADYFPAKTHWNWRWQLDFGGGQLCDWIGHHCDIAHWGLDMDYDAPVEIEGTGVFPKTGPWDAPSSYRVNTRYRNGVKMTIAGGHDDIKMGVKWFGENGRWVYVRRGQIDANPKSLLGVTFGPNDTHVYYSDNHHRNFINCVKNRKLTITPCEVAHHSQIPGHLSNIAMKLHRPIKFDPNREEIIGDPEANAMLRTPMRGPWHL